MPTWMLTASSWLATCPAASRWPPGTARGAHAARHTGCARTQRAQEGGGERGRRETTSQGCRVQCTMTASSGNGAHCCSRPCKHTADGLATQFVPGCVPPPEHPAEHIRPCVQAPHVLAAHHCAAGVAAHMGKEHAVCTNMNIHSHEHESHVWAERSGCRAGNPAAQQQRKPFGRVRQLHSTLNKCTGQPGPGPCCAPPCAHLCASCMHGPRMQT